MRRVVLFIFLMACGSGYARTAVRATWISGPNTVNQPGVCNAMGVPDPANVPEARMSSVSWTDSQGNFWLFGGYSYRSEFPVQIFLNDLWKFDGSNWTCVYESRGGGLDYPAVRAGAVSWIDGDDNLWLFGGFSASTRPQDPGGYLSDLWRFDGVSWSLINNQAVPGTSGSVSWIDQDGDLWLFGGMNSTQYSNALYKYDGSQWTLVRGMTPANYGVKGIADPLNMPPSRAGSFSWIDQDDNLWLFGGQKFTSTYKDYSDLWRFDGVNWTWMGGSNLTDQPGVYGTKGIAHASNIPGARSGGVSWVDAEGHFWLFGGKGAGSYNDLWKFDGQNWTWVGGANVPGQPGISGTKGIANSANMPGARHSSVGWKDPNGGLLLFGGYYQGCFSDLWRFEIFTVYTMEDFEAFASAWLSEAGEANFDSAWDISVPKDGRIDLLDLQAFCETWLAG